MIECVLDYRELTPEGRLKLKCHGAGEYEVFTGEDQFGSNVNCSLRMFGPIPVGSYYIVNRESGSWKNIIRAFGIDAWKYLVHGAVNDHSKWFSLISTVSRADNLNASKIARGAFRLHPVNSDGMGVSEGCITLSKYSQFYVLRSMLLATDPKKIVVLIDSVPHEVNAYGVVHVIGHPDFTKCKVK